MCGCGNCCILRIKIINNMKIFITYTILFLSLVLTACGQENTTDKIPSNVEANVTPLQNTDEQTKLSPSETYRRYAEAYKQGDVAKVKELTTKKTFAGLEEMAKALGNDLAEEMRRQASLIPEDKQALEIRNEKIDGDRATMEISNPNNGIWIETLLIKEDGIWKIGEGERIEEIKKGIKDKFEQMKKQRAN